MRSWDTKPPRLVVLVATLVVCTCTWKTRWLFSTVSNEAFANFFIYMAHLAFEGAWCILVFAGWLELRAFSHRINTASREHRGTFSCIRAYSRSEMPEQIEQHSSFNVTLFLTFTLHYWLMLVRGSLETHQMMFTLSLRTTSFCFAA